MPYSQALLGPSPETLSMDSPMPSSNPLDLPAVTSQANQAAGISTLQQPIETIDEMQSIEQTRK